MLFALTQLSGFSWPPYNQVRLKGAGEKRVDWQPWRLKKVEVYEQEKRELRVGDLVRFTRNDRERGRKNGETGRVVEVDEGSRSVVDETEPVKGQVARHGLDLRQDQGRDRGPGLDQRGSGPGGYRRALRPAGSARARQQPPRGRRPGDQRSKHDARAFDRGVGPESPRTAASGAAPPRRPPTLTHAPKKTVTRS